MDREVIKNNQETFLKSNFLTGWGGEGAFRWFQLQGILELFSRIYPDYF